MLLENKNAIVYGAGSIGGAVARAFAEEGATVFIANRASERGAAVAAAIREGGGQASAARVDALDKQQVDAFVDSVAAEAGSVDVSFNLIDVEDVQGTPLIEMDYADFARPIENALRSHFLTATAAARHMVRQGGGVLLAFGGEGEPVRNYSIGGFQIAMHAVEGLRRQISSELGAQGVRMVTLRTGGIPESLAGEFPGAEEIVEGLTAMTMTGRAATLADVGRVAAFVASDAARTMTAATVNVSAGALVD